MRALRDRPCWVFDMDGTLTVPMHDFDALRRRLDLPEGAPILEALAEASPVRRARLEAEVDAWEGELAEQAVAQEDARALLEALDGRGCRLAVLTRNTRAHAVTTLRVTGLDVFFDPQDVLGRHEAEPKPDPAGVQRILGRWGVDGTSAVMVGDWVHDVRAGARAGAATVLVHRPGRARAEWFVEADVVVEDLRLLLRPMPLR